MIKILGGGGNFLETSVVLVISDSVHKKMQLYKYYKYTVLSLCCFYINLKIKFEIITI